MGDLPPLPDEVWADPGRRGWYFREKKPDSVTRYVRADLYDARTSEFAMARTDADQLRMTLRQVEAERDAIRAQVELLHGAMLRVQVRIGQPCILEKLNSVRSIVNAALAKSTGGDDG